MNAEHWDAVERIIDDYDHSLSFMPEPLAREQVRDDIKALRACLARAERAGELLEAAKELMDYYDSGGSYEHINFNQLMNRLDAAINKAEGGDA